MKIFISHKNEDSITAKRISLLLKLSNVDTYLDLMDNMEIKSAKELTDHLKGRMNECTDLLVVLSNKTWESWWVPFEIGMAAQKDFPMVSFMKDLVRPPEYLSYYPMLRSEKDIEKYLQKIRSRLSEAATIEKSFGKLNESINFSKRANLTEKFYRDLKSVL